MSRVDKLDTRWVGSKLFEYLPFTTSCCSLKPGRPSSNSRSDSLRLPSKLDADSSTSTAQKNRLEGISAYHSVSDDGRGEPLEASTARALYNFEGRLTFENRELFEL